MVAFGLGKAKRCLAGVLEDGAKSAASGRKHESEGY
jgi:hypothetical protein